MKCAYCGKPVDLKKAMREAGAKGGKKSRRILTSEQARAMSMKSAEKRRHKQISLP